MRLRRVDKMNQCLEECWSIDAQPNIFRPNLVLCMKKLWVSKVSAKSTVRYTHIINMFVFSQARDVRKRTDIWFILLGFGENRI